MIPEIKGTIVSHRNDGMGARLIAALNGIRVARAYDLPWHMSWTTHGRTRIEVRYPAQIFDGDWLAANVSDVEVITGLYEDLIDLSTFDDTMTSERFRQMARDGRNFLSGSAMGVTVLPWEDADEVAAQLPDCLDGLHFSAPIRAMIGRIDEVFQGKRLTAYHIRRGDIIHDPIASNKLWPNKYIPREFYETHLDRTLRDPEARVLVFSDTPEEVARLKARSDRVTTFDDLMGESELTFGARDFLELYAMSRCPEVYGPPSSAFSQTAVTIGGGTLRAVQDALSADEQAAAMDLMTERLEARSDLFLNMGDVGQCLHFLIAHQSAKGNPNRAKRIIRGYMDEGLDKSYAYQLLCELSVGAGELKHCERVRDIAYTRPVYVDDSLAVVNAYAGLSRLVKGDWETARDHLASAHWFRPLDPLTHGVLNLALSAGAITPQNFYPFDDAFLRPKQNVFPAGKPSLNALNEFAPKGVDPDERYSFYPWDLVVRDWRLVCGKKLNRAFTNKSKILRNRQMIERSYSKMADTPSYVSAMGVVSRALGDLDGALEAQRAAMKADPRNALFRKRLSDVHYEMGNAKAGLHQLRRGQVRAGNHPCYLAELGHRLHQFGRRGEALEVHKTLAGMDHNYIEVHLMVAEALRRNPDLWELGVQQLDKGLVTGHGAARLLAAKARLLMLLERTDAATEIYGQMVDWGLGTEYTHVQILQLFRQIGQEDVARGLTGRSIYAFDDIVAMADGVAKSEAA